MRFSFPLLLSLCLVITGCAKHDSEDSGETAAAATPVQVAEVKQQPIHRYVTAEAVLYPLQQASIVPKISAPVARFLVQRGDHVKEGQLLAVLEHRDLAAAAQESEQLYRQAQAQYVSTSKATVVEDMTKAKADVVAAKQALDTAKTLYQNRLALVREGALAQKLADDAHVALVQAQTQYETAQQHLSSFETVGESEQLKSARAQEDAAKAHYESSAAQESYAEVRSPISGVVSDRPLNVGEMASSGSALLSIVNLAHVVARANIPVAEAATIKLGRPASIAGPGATLNGKVTVVSPAVDPNTTTLQIWVEASNPDESLKPGATVHISVDAGEIPNAIVVPVAALLAGENGGQKVMLAGSDGLAHEQEVTVGIRSGDLVQITEGLKPGEQVITEGALGLDDKAKIHIGAPAAESDKGEKE